MANKKVLLIDNFDSFVYKLGEEFSRQDCDVQVYRANWDIEAALAYIDQQKPDLLIMSPGPGAPHQATLCMSLLDRVPETLPIFGVCLGHQCMIEYFGGKVTKCQEVFHGKASPVTHHNQGLFLNLPNPMQVARYHSLAGSIIPDCLLVDAQCGDTMMAVRHATRPIYGVQFHPESVLTPDGPHLIANLLESIK